MAITVREKQGRLFVLSAPSGSGKSTLKDRVIQRRPELVYSVSYTTRRPRPGEIDGRDYNFVTTEQFQTMIRAGDFLEWAEVFGRFYGTGRQWVADKLAGGLDVLADLDVAGGAAVRRLRPQATLIFLVPPTLAELRRRLISRQTETDEEISRRLAKARAEIRQRHFYDYLLVNDQLEPAVAELEDIIQGRRGRPMAGSDDFWQNFFAGEGGE
ncbi:MAG: guanylate kinase [Candidatus Adiutrix sp.]|jgi:guanylate kinase|nr:guanylate kinase [Candidatus Adiutrix sp.]